MRDISENTLMTTIPGVVSNSDAPKTDSAMMNNISVHIAKRNRLPDDILHKSVEVTDDMVAEGGVSLSRNYSNSSLPCAICPSHTDIERLAYYKKAQWSLRQDMLPTRA